MTSTKNIHIADYNYDLPDERIAKFPLAQRDSSKLLIYNKGVVSEDVFTSLPQYLQDRRRHQGRECHPQARRHPRVGQLRRVPGA